MEAKYKELVEKYSNLKFELKDYNADEVDVDEQLYIEISGFKGNESLILTIEDEDEFEVMESILESEFVFTSNLFGVQKENEIEIAISPVNIKSHRFGRSKLRHEPVLFEMNYFKNNLNIKLQYNPSDSLLFKINELVFTSKSPLILTIEGFNKPTVEGMDNDIRNILNTVLFDFGYTYNAVFEPVSFNSFNRRTPIRPRNVFKPPVEKINIVYKKYIPELLEYFNIGEKVDYLPFKFICYYHIIEYFSDKSAYFYASKKLKSLLLKPDFHINSDKYVTQAINFFKIEATKNTSDKVKIKRVIGQFIEKEDFLEYLKEIDSLEYFGNPCTIPCSKPLELNVINFESQPMFEESMMKRIYSMRCSIVHSNPDFDETKAIPFSPTLENLEKLRKEIDIIYEIARTIITESSGN
jgi:hypothetical protein